METERRPEAPGDELSRFLLDGAVSHPLLMPEGSNDTFLVSVSDGGQTRDAIYKPRRGERPLWDFPAGTLYKREYAAYLVAKALAWDFIPCTVIRDGPYGVGSVQQFIDADSESDYFTLREERPEEIARIALFDHLTNNADRKASHCFKDWGGRVWSIDHGITFHEDYKLRTVIWDFVGEPIAARLMEQMAAFLEELRSADGVARELSQLLFPEEVDALDRRIEGLLASGRYPAADPYRRNVPWPWF